MRRRDTLPVIDPTELSANSGDRPTKIVHGVVLAAGTSSRYGERNKLLEPLDGEPLVAHAVRALLAADLDGVTVVVGHAGERVGAAIADLVDRDGVAVRTNERYEEGQSTSVATGVAAARDLDADAVVLALGDMPAVSVASINSLVTAYQNGGDALAAAYEGNRGNPVLFGRGHFEDLLAVDGDIGGREILLAEGAVVETGDPGVLRDVDRPDDL